MHDFTSTVYMIVEHYKSESKLMSNKLKGLAVH
jgi:hypothetical protein